MYVWVGRSLLNLASEHIPEQSESLEGSEENEKRILKLRLLALTPRHSPPSPCPAKRAKITLAHPYFQGLSASGHRCLIRTLFWVRASGYIGCGIQGVGLRISGLGLGT